jgi:hypothetical protein
VNSDLWEPNFGFYWTCRSYFDINYVNQHLKTNILRHCSWNNLLKPRIP